MVLHCPKCGEQHIDKAQPDVCEICGRDREAHSIDEADSLCSGFKAWLNPAHKTHRCHFCNFVWKPFDYPTNGVETLTVQVGEKGVSESRLRVVFQRNVVAGLNSNKKPGRVFYQKPVSPDSLDKTRTFPVSSTFYKIMNSNQIASGNAFADENKRKSLLKLGLTLLGCAATFGYLYYATTLFPKESYWLNLTLLFIIYGGLLVGLAYLSSYIQSLIIKVDISEKALQTLGARKINWLLRGVKAAALLTATGLVGKMMPFNERLFNTSNDFTVFFKDYSNLFLLAGVGLFVLIFVAGLIYRLTSGRNKPAE